MLIPATNIIQHLMVIITIVKHSEYIYVILMTQIEGIQFFFLQSDIKFPELWPFQVFTKESIFESTTFLKIPMAQILSVTEQFKTCNLKGNCTRIPNLSSNLRLEHYL